jgi:hypothetical protein
VSVAPVDFKLEAIIDLPPAMRRYGLYRWKTARGRTTKWHLIDTETQMAESVGPYRASHDLPPMGKLPMLCGVRCPSVGCETRIRTWEELCGMTVMRWDSVLKQTVREADEVCGACIILAVKALMGGLE